jgi:iron complex transport system substrate-binding protein
VLGDEIVGNWRKTLLKMAELLNKTDVAEKALKEYEDKAKTTRDKVKQTIGDKSAAILWLSKKTFYVVNGKVASGAVLYGDLGLKSPNILAVLPDAKANWVSISLEKLAELDADYIFLVNSDKGQAGNLEEPLWRNIPAVKAGHVYEFDRSGSWLYNGLIAGSKVMDDVVKSLSK